MISLNVTLRIKFASNPAASVIAASCGLICIILAVFSVVSILPINTAKHCRTVTVGQSQINKTNEKKRIYRSYRGEELNIQIDHSCDAVKTIQPEPRVIQENAAKFVSICGSDLDERRVGNQLFNYAALLYVAKLTNRTALMSSMAGYVWIDSIFDVKIRRVDWNLLNRTLCPCYTFTESHSMRFDERLLMLPDNPDARDKTILLCGYYQSWKYLFPIEKELRCQLNFHRMVGLKLAAQMMISKHVSLRGNYSEFRVGVHVRRGDLLNSGNLQFGYTVPSKSYFRRAVQYFKNRYKNVQLVIASDDMKWTSRALVGLGNHVNSIYFSNASFPAVDLSLLRHCDAVIISTGTFGWWAGWLANNTTIYYRHWPKPSSQLEESFTKADYFPSNWISMF